MRITPAAFLISALFVAGCSSNANPMNWFGRDGPEPEVLEPIDAANPLIPESSGLFRSDPTERLQYQGSTIDAISDLTIERVPGGIIIRATGRSATQGPFNARLTPLNKDELPQDGVLGYQLQAQYKQIIGGAPETRDVTVARRLTDQQLEGTRTIRVEGLQNALERRR
jgi:hypothetical protein